MLSRWRLLRYWSEFRRAGRAKGWSARRYDEYHFGMFLLKKAQEADND
jgi:hypothetical protein